MSTGGQTRVLRRDEILPLGRTKHWVWPREQYDEGEAVLALALTECLDEMQRNGGNIEAALGRSPRLAAHIRPLLEVAAMLLPKRI